jgi:hypothetical protein
MKYKGVSEIKMRRSTNSKPKFQATYKGRRSYHSTPEAAAKWYDIQLIKAGKEPINILKRK